MKDLARQQTLWPEFCKFVILNSCILDLADINSFEAKIKFGREPLWAWAAAVVASSFWKMNKSNPNFAWSFKRTVKCLPADFVAVWMPCGCGELGCEWVVISWTLRFAYSLWARYFCRISESTKGDRLLQSWVRTTQECLCGVMCTAWFMNCAILECVKFKLFTFSPSNGKQIEIDDNVTECAQNSWKRSN